MDTDQGLFRYSGSRLGGLIAVLVAFAVDLKPFVVSGLGLGGVYAMSAVGLVTIFRTTGVVNFAYGAIGGAGAMVAWSLGSTGVPEALVIVACVAVAVVLSVGYGSLIAPRLSQRDPAVRATATLGYALVLLGIMLLIWRNDARTTTLPTDSGGFFVFGAHVITTQVVALGLALLTTIVVSVGLSRSRLGTAMRALAGDRELSTLLGIRVRRAETAAWTIGGIVAGLSGLLLANLVTTEPTTLTFLVVATLAAAVTGRLSSLWLTLSGGLFIGVVQSLALTSTGLSSYRNATPFVVAVVVLLGLQLRSGGVRER